MLIRSIVPALAVCLLAGCATPPKSPATPSFDPTSATFLLYAGPVPKEALRLSARLAGVSAVREDGGIVPLQLIDAEVAPPGESAQRLVARGALPAGRYAGLEVTVAEAAVAGPDGTTPLHVPEAPARLDQPFTAAEGRGVVVDWELDLKAALVDGFRFVPVFRASIPTRPLAGLVGMASLTEEGLVLTFDRRSGRVAGVTPVGRRPLGITLDSPRRRAYVAVSGDDALVAIDLEQGTVVERRPLRGGDNPVDLTLTPDGERLLVANEGSSSVAIVDTQGLAELYRVDLAREGSDPSAGPTFLPVGAGPTSVLLDRDGERAFVPCRGANQVVVLAPSTACSEDRIARWCPVAKIGAEPSPFRAQLNRAGTKLYVAHEGSPYVMVVVVAGRSGAESGGMFGATSRAFVGPGQTAIRVDQASDRVYLARRGTGKIEVFDPLSLLAIDRLPVTGEVAYMTLDRETASILAALPKAGRIDRISPVSGSIVNVVATGPGVRFVALAGER
jgi:DNA-binding beta-propeller fold protein YncE